MERCSSSRSIYGSRPIRVCRGLTKARTRGWTPLRRVCTTCRERLYGTGRMGRAGEGDYRVTDRSYIPPEMLSFRGYQHYYLIMY
ncbi:hypothetical protein BC629DRAFT_1500082, partial [Irpex lacteus]